MEAGFLLTLMKYAFFALHDKINGIFIFYVLCGLHIDVPHAYYKSSKMTNFQVNKNNDSMAKPTNIVCTEKRLVSA